MKQYTVENLKDIPFAIELEGNFLIVRPIYYSKYKIDLETKKVYYFNPVFGSWLSVKKYNTLIFLISHFLFPVLYFIKYLVFRESSDFYITLLSLFALIFSLHFFLIFHNSIKLVLSKIENI